MNTGSLGALLTPSGFSGGAGYTGQAGPLVAAPTNGTVKAASTSKPAATTASTTATPADITGSAGSTTGSSSLDPNAVAYYTDLINQLTTQLTGAQGIEQTGLNNINTGYTNAVGQETSNRDTAAAQNGVNRETGIGSINTNANQAYNALMTLLGHSGAGVSSAASTNVPYAVSQNASGQRQGVTTTYNANDANIKQSYTNALNDLLNSKNTNVQNFESGLLNQEGSLEQQIAAAQINRGEAGGESYTAAATGAGDTTKAVGDIQNQLNSIFSQYGTPTYTPAAAPNLASYTVDPSVVKAAATNPTTDTSFLPYLNNLQNPNNILTGTPAATAGATS